MIRWRRSLADLGPFLERLLREVDVAERLQFDPVAFPRRYTRPADIEIAAVFASQLAYGRVRAFGPVLERLFAILDDQGGPEAFVDHGGCDDALEGLSYRWNRGADWVLMTGALRRVRQRYGTIGAAFEGPSAQRALQTGVGALRAGACEAARDRGLRGDRFSELPRGLRYWLVLPEDGSACKRWNLLLRWMVRPDTDGIDLALWSHLRAEALVIPLDTHVHRVARFLGLTARAAADWKTAVEITEALRALDADDPVRFDFALAHLGISGACRGKRDAEVCPRCPLDRVCMA